MKPFIVPVPKNNTNKIAVKETIQNMTATINSISKEGEVVIAFKDAKFLPNLTDYSALINAINSNNKTFSFTIIKDNLREVSNPEEILLDEKFDSNEPITVIAWQVTNMTPSNLTLQVVFNDPHIITLST